MEFEAGQKKATEEFLKKQGKRKFVWIQPFFHLTPFFVNLLNYHYFRQITKRGRRTSTKTSCFSKGTIASRNYTRTRTTC
jgi:hypothetical protein